MAVELLLLILITLLMLVLARAGAVAEGEGAFGVGHMGVGHVGAVAEAGTALRSRPHQSRRRHQSHQRGRRLLCTGVAEEVLVTMSVAEEVTSAAAAPAQPAAARPTSCLSDG